MSIGVPPGACCTKVSCRLANPEALEARKERYKAQEGFTNTVLGVLTEDEVKEYAAATQKMIGN
jgi:hypothetical protein